MFKNTRSFFLMCLFCLVSMAVTAQTLQMTQQPALNFKKLNPNLEYAFIINKPTSPNPKEGDQIFINMQMTCNNRLLFNSIQSNKGKPALYGVTKPGFKGDVIEAITLMTPGDSIACLVDADALFRNTKNKKPDFIKTGDKIQYLIKLVSVKTKEQIQKEQQALIDKQIKAQMAKQKEAADKQLMKDDKALKDYFTKNNLTPVKTASGLYYKIIEEGFAEKPLAGDSVIMNYTGHLLDGTKFDSNEDTAFHHVIPLQFILGRGMVIRGWDEGVALLKVGAKATLYIPSGLAYGASAMPGSGANPKGIPSNSVLIFNVQLASSKHPAPPAPVIPQKDSVHTPVPKPTQKNN